MGPRATAQLVVLACALAAFAGFGTGIAFAAAKLPPVTISQYEHSTTPATLDAQGCNAGRAARPGSGDPRFRPSRVQDGAVRHARLLQGTFQWNVRDQQGGRGLHDRVHAVPPGGLKGMLSVARGTNNSCSNEDLHCCPNECDLEPTVVHQGRVLVGGADESGRKVGDRQGLEVQGQGDRRDRCGAGLGSAVSATERFVRAFDYTARHSGWKLPPLLWDFGSLEPGLLVAPTRSGSSPHGGSA